MQNFKQEFKEDLYKTGIYKISALYDSYLFYIGMTGKVGKYNSNAGFYYRWNRHLYDLSKNRHCNPFLQRIYNKYGINSLKFEIIEVCDFKECIEKEILMIELLKPPLNLYKNKYCRTNYKVSYATRQKIIKAHTGRKNSKETIEKMRMSNNKIQYRYINNIKIPLSEIIDIPVQVLEEIKFNILQKNFTFYKILKVFKFTKNRIIKNLKLHFKDDNLINTLTFNKYKKQSFIKPNSKSKNKTTINRILELYKEGVLIKNISSQVNLNSDTVGIIIKNNLSELERKQIRSKNAKRK